MSDISDPHSGRLLVTDVRAGGSGVFIPEAYRHPDTDILWRLRMRAGAKYNLCERIRMFLDRERNYTLTLIQWHTLCVV